ncbi:squamosa promoter-binding-like protein 12 [Cocos nucifera]|uniref:Squamosa promoter-binding-like protein 12 n=1 Tax=Cocos nucifera TaxID=13894 RepID=A0A8K0HVW4_COCNU|nr:squamosa promoter-binding-like protein 12 [Cocos nucifera]
MEPKVGGKRQQFYGAGTSSGLGKKSLEWDLNGWKWDGNHCVATPLNSVSEDRWNKQLMSAPATRGLSNGSSFCPEETDLGITGKGKAELEKRRRVTVADDDEPCDGSLTLKLGGHASELVEADLANWEGKNGNRSKLAGGNPSHPSCQVEGCGADLSNAKDYHRRHKVCEMHSKTSMAIVGNVMQRFCQQCSRFHLLQEFDEGKRSCRRRLAGHNLRRRKTNPDANTAVGSLNDNHASSFLLISLLRVLANLQSDSSGQSKDQDLLTHLLRNLANLAGSFDARNLPGLPQASQDLHKFGISAGTSSEAGNALHGDGLVVQESSRPLSVPFKVACTTGFPVPSMRPLDHSASVVASVEIPLEKNIAEASLGETALTIPAPCSANFVPVEDVLSVKAQDLCSSRRILPAESRLERDRMKDFDLNVYSDEQDGEEACELPIALATQATGSPNCPSWMLQQSSSHQTSRNSDSSSAQSLSSNRDTQSRTDRIVFKLFGKNPNDVPLVLQTQIFDWLSHSPSDMESYIRPGCIILTVYLRLAESLWEELSHDLNSSLNRLLWISHDDFWRTGWVYARVPHRMAFIYNGQVVLDAPLPLQSSYPCKLLCITPIAAAVSAKVNFTVKCFNLVHSASRLLCAFEGEYLVQEATQIFFGGSNTGKEHEGCWSFSFYCSLPSAMGRGFVEVEDDGLSSASFPFIVAEEDMCSEICMLESAINVSSCGDLLDERMDAINARNQAMDFLQEMGWLLRRSHLRSKSEQDSCLNVFSMSRFRWLMSFALNREWCAVVKKLLDILFQGNIDLGGQSPVQFALSEDLLHRAVRRKSKPMVELLLRYKPNAATEKTGPDVFLFGPDMLGPSNITPLHIAATISGAERLLDALTDDPLQLGVRAWSTVHDSTGFTPEDYARSRGHGSYIQLVRRKLGDKSDKGHVVLHINGNDDATYKQADGSCSGKPSGFQIEKSKIRSAPPPYCKRCDQQLAYSRSMSSSLLYRPAMLAMVGIAAVCVCVALLFKGPPEVLLVYPPFRWELLDYGYM